MNIMEVNRQEGRPLTDSEHLEDLTEACRNERKALSKEHKEIMRRQRQESRVLNSSLPMQILRTTVEFIRDTLVPGVE